jgi:hypothetical protein
MTQICDQQQIILNNPCKEIVGVQPMDVGVFYALYIPSMEFKVTQKSKYQFSREWFKGEFGPEQYHEVREWCVEHFGPLDKNPDAWSRWRHYYVNEIHFRDEIDYTLFLLRWSN